MKKQALIMMSCVILTGCSMNEKSIDVADVTGQMTQEEKEDRIHKLAERYGVKLL